MVSKNNIQNKEEFKVTDKEFFAALSLIQQMLLTVRDMAQCTGREEVDEKNRKNSAILKSNIFKHDICKILRFGFELYNTRLHSEAQLT